MTQFIKEQLHQKKVSSLLSKWMTELEDNYDIQHSSSLSADIWRNGKIYDEIQAFIMKCNSPNAVNDICSHLFRLFKSDDPGNQLYAVSLFPCLVLSLLDHSTWTNPRKSGYALKLDPERAETSRSTAYRSLESVIAAIASVCIMRNKDVFCGTLLDRKTLQQLRQFGSVFHQKLDVSADTFEAGLKSVRAAKFPEGTPIGSRNFHVVIAILLDTYCELLLKPSEATFRSVPTLLQSLEQMTSLVGRFCSFNDQFRIAHSSGLLLRCLGFVDLLLFKTTHTENDALVQLRKHAIAILLRLERLATYHCDSTVLLAANALISLMSRQLGDLDKGVPDEVLNLGDVSSQLPGSRRMSVLEDTGAEGAVLLSPNHAENESFDLDLSSQPNASMRRSRTRGLSTVGAITNSSFIPEILPEDITPEESAAKGESHALKEKRGIRANIQQMLHTHQPAAGGESSH